MPSSRAPLSGLGLPDALCAFLLALRRVGLLPRALPDRKKVVRIVIVQRSHSEDRAGLRVHGDRARAVDGVVVQRRLPQMLFHIILHRGVERQDDVAAFFSRPVVLIARKQQLAAVGVGRPERAGGRAGENRVVSRLDPLEADVVRADEAEQMAGQTGVWIIALGVRLEAHALQAVLGLEGPDPVRLLAFELAGGGDIPAPLAPGLLVQRLRVGAQDLGQTPCDQLAVLSVGFDLHRAEIDVLDRRADSQRVPVRVGDRPARRGALRFAKLLLERKRLVKIMLADLQAVEPRQQYGQHPDPEQR